MKRLTNVLFCLCCIALLVSCAQNQKKRPNAVMDLMDLSHLDFYQFNGKMSFSDGQEGGSGQFTWFSDQQQTKLVLKAPLSKKSWELIESTEGAQLKLSDGDELFGVSAKTLISEQLGWEVPWVAFKLWVIGQKTSNGKARNNEDGMQIFDQGWEINYSQLKPYGDEYLPHKITARKNSYAIKVIIKQWQW